MPDAVIKPCNSGSSLCRVGALLALLLIGGCASNGQVRDEGDPWEPLNRATYGFNDQVDRFVLKPVAKGYQRITPSAINRAVTNFFSNIDDFLVLINDVLQLKYHQAVSDTSRLLVNSTMGLLGLIDVASGLDLPKHEEDFGQTLAVWGIGPGPYFVLPVLGPSTVRDTVGLVPAFLLSPLRWFERTADAQYGLIALRIVDTRADLLASTDVLEQAALDRYIFTRDAFLQRRRYLIHDGNPPEEFDFDLDLEEDVFDEPGRGQGEALEDSR